MRQLLHEGEGHIVTVELKSGEMYRGTLVDAEDNMNCELRNIQYTARNGQTSKLERVYIRGSNVRFVVLPDMLKNAPMFKKIGQKAPSARPSVAPTSGGVARARVCAPGSACVVARVSRAVARFFSSRSNTWLMLLCACLCVCVCARKRCVYARLLCVGVNMAEPLYCFVGVPRRSAETGSNVIELHKRTTRYDDNSNNKTNNHNNDNDDATKPTD